MCVCFWQKETNPYCCAFHGDSDWTGLLRQKQREREKKKAFLLCASAHVSTLRTTRAKSEGSRQICRYKFKVGGRRCSGGSQVPPAGSVSRKCRRWWRSCGGRGQQLLLPPEIVARCLSDQPRLTLYLEWMKAAELGKKRGESDLIMYTVCGGNTGNQFNMCE